ncbi:hypothetical protein [Streptomyces sp. NPDC040750]|uniref:hypothetical protein n=1 Tax=Streptomyces sp. NPDC040750 TaxID=3154491 RepID=UPI0033E5F599
MSGFAYFFRGPGLHALRLAGQRRVGRLPEADRPELAHPADVVGQWDGLFALLDAGPAIELALDWIGRAEGAAAATPLDPATLTAFAHHFMTGSPDTTVVNTVSSRLRQTRERLSALPDQFKWTAALGFAATTRPGSLTEIGNGFSTFHGPNGRAAALIHEAIHFRFDVPEWSGEVVAGVQQSPAVINGVTMPRYSTIPTADALVTGSRRESDMALRQSCPLRASPTRQRQRPGHRTCTSDTQATTFNRHSHPQ